VPPTSANDSKKANNGGGIGAGIPSQPQKCLASAAEGNASSTAFGTPASAAAAAAVASAFLSQLNSGSSGESATGRRKRRHRTIFTEEQLQMLEQMFNHTHYPGQSEANSK